MSKAAPYYEEGKQVGWQYICPGCGSHHALYCEPFCSQITHPHHCWKFNGDTERPTFTPSVNSIQEWDSHENLTEVDYTPWEERPDKTRSRSILPASKHKLVHRRHVCHSHVTDGRVSFLADCTHAKRSQTVDLPEYE